jgi:Ran GTPase-activating protein (RanGAP) involved in mRNA processing and transport
MAGCNLGFIGLQSLLKMTHSTITKLDLSGNNLQTKGVETIARFLKDSNRALCILYLADNNIGYHGAEHIVSLLKVKPKPSV